MQTGQIAGKRSVAKFRCEATLERELQSRGFTLVAGVDEVGRGALFGPVVAAAVILSPDRPVRGLNDSKQLEPAQREFLADRIREWAVCWSVSAVDAATIDSINIYEASRLAMKTAVEQLQPAADFVLVDAMALKISTSQRALIKGDEQCQAIAAASILAKVWRDACMASWDGAYPAYGLKNHMGYGTPEHLRALAAHGPSPLHRFTFAPVRSHSLFPLQTQLGLFKMEAAACR